MITVKIKREKDSIQIPTYMTTGASGCDVRANLEHPISVEPGQRVAVPTGLYFEIPDGFEIQVRPRSGLAIKKGLTVVNAPGTIDSDYRGELKVLLINLGVETVLIEHEERVAQLVLQRVERAEWIEVNELASSSREAGGFGSTGTK